MLIKQKQMAVKLPSRKSFCICLIITIILVINTTAICQERLVYSEAPDSFKENGVYYSNRITLKFNEKVFELGEGVVNTSISEIPANHSSLKSAFIKLEQKYGTFSFRKKMPNARWGDVWRTHRVTKKPVKIHEWSQLFSLEFDNFVPVDSVLRLIRTFSEIKYTRGPVVAIADSEPDDPHYVDDEDLQWYLFKTNSEDAWDITKGNSNLRIGIVDFDNPYTAHKDFWTGSGTSGNSKFDETPSGSGVGDHPTKIAGLIGAATDDGDGITSLGWSLMMNAYRASGDNDIVNQMNAAIDDGCDVINCSFTLYSDEKTFDSGCGCDIREPLQSGQLFDDIEEVFDDAATAGIVVVGTMANSGYNRIDNPEKPGCNPDECSDSVVPFTPYPGAYDDVICVTATDTDDDVPNNYNFGNFIDVSAPGINIFSTTTADTYAIDNGSSFSAPIVSALAGLILSVNPNLSISQVENVIESTADPINETASRGGAGRINAYEALKYTIENHGGTIGGNGETVIFHEDITISSGVTLTIESGTTVELEPDIKFTVNGILDAQGTSSNPITFKRNGSSGTWDGIYISGSSASSTELVYCTIKNASIGIDISNSDPLIEKCYVHSCSSYPLKLTSGATPKVLNNKFYAASTHAVYISSAGGDFGANEFRTSSGTTYGVYVTGSIANPSFDNKWGDGGNLFDLSNIASNGAYAAGGYPEFGSNGAREGENDFINRGSSDYYITNNTGSTFDAEYNYWGGTPQVSWFGGDDNVDYNPYESSSNSAGPSWKIMVDPFQPGLTKYEEGNYAEALAELKSVLEQNEESDGAVGAVFKMAMSASKIDVLAEQEAFLVDLSNSENTEVQYMSRVWLAYLYFQQQKMQDAEKIALQAPTGSLAERSELLALVSYYSSLGDTRSTTRIAEILKDHHKDEYLTYDLGEAVNNQLVFQDNLTKTTAEKNAGFSLTNYPNPFNPETIISYNLPQKSTVLLKLYDLRGRLIQVLVNGIQDQGMHEVSFNASGLPSGVYPYTIEAMGRKASARLTILK
ncbi:MAG: T9SS C-terminal target domain-containing protein [Calditrichaeota bacterium]|nr:MAG: T9SS C-terminal target domain-containing protein [Calditrichota bacterium]